METNNLMLGDLVYIKSGRRPVAGPGKVCQFCKTMIYARPLDDEEQVIDAYLTLFEPIELTNNMLLLNGFGKSENIDWFWLTGFPFDISKCSYRDPSVYEVSVGNGGIVRTIKYVHELQNLLRVVGLEELANNFKLK